MNLASNNLPLKFKKTPRRGGRPPGPTPLEGLPGLDLLARIVLYRTRGVPQGLRRAILRTPDEQLEPMMLSSWVNLDRQRQGRYLNSARVLPGRLGDRQIQFVMQVLERCLQKVNARSRIREALGSRKSREQTREAHERTRDEDHVARLGRDFHSELLVEIEGARSRIVSIEPDPKRLKRLRAIAWTLLARPMAHVLEGLEHWLEENPRLVGQILTEHGPRNSPTDQARKLLAVALGVSEMSLERKRKEFVQIRRRQSGGIGRGDVLES